MPEWILQHWAKWFFGLLGTGIVAAATLFWRKLRARRSRMDRMDEEIKTLRDGMEALMVANRASMYDRLYYLHGRFMKQGWISIPDLENVTSIYHGYCGLNGNHIGPKLYEDICGLPHFEPM